MLSLSIINMNICVIYIGWLDIFIWKLIISFVWLSVFFVAPVPFHTVHHFFVSWEEFTDVVILNVLSSLSQNIIHPSFGSFVCLGGRALSLSAYLISQLLLPYSSLFVAGGGGGGTIPALLGSFCLSLFTIFSFYQFINFIMI